MKKVLFLLLFLFSACDNGVIVPEDFDPDRPRLFLGGQSNASPELLAEIESAAGDLFYIKGQNWPGKSLMNWYDGGAKSLLKQDYEFIGQFPEPHYILWFQGESDRFYPWQDYKTKFQGMRRWYNDRYPNLKFIILEVYTTNTDIDPRGNLTGVRHAQEILAADSPRIDIIDTKPYERGDGSHLTEQSRKALAAEIVRYMSNL